MGNICCRSRKGNSAAPGAEDKVLSEQYDTHLLAYNRAGRSARSTRAAAARLPPPSPFTDLIRTLPADVQEQARALMTPGHNGDGATGSTPAVDAAALAAAARDGAVDEDAVAGVSLLAAFTAAYVDVSESEAEVGAGSRKRGAKGKGGKAAAAAAAAAAAPVTSNGPVARKSLAAAAKAAAEATDSEAEAEETEAEPETEAEAETETKKGTRKSSGSKKASASVSASAKKAAAKASESDARRRR